MIATTDVRRRLAGSGPLSLRAHVVLLLAAALLGAALAAVVFVGVWRDTASRGDRAAAAQAETRAQAAKAKAQLAASARLLESVRLDLRRALARERGLAAARAKDAKSLAAARVSLDAAAARSASLAKSADTLASELKAIQSYVRTTPSGLDAGFLSTQVDYMLRNAQQLSRAARASSPSP